MIKTTNGKIRTIISFLMKTVAMLLVLLLVGEDPLGIIGRVSAYERVVYLKEIKLFEADSEGEARSICQSEGYIFVATDLNSGTGKNYVFLGYKTTENKDEALYKISLLEMNSGYQIKDYAQVCEEFKKSNYGTAETLQLATTEFIDSYKIGSPKALDAYEGMNLLNVPEADGMKFGDYVISGRTNTDFYAKVLTQSSSGTVSSIINFLYAGLSPYTPDSGKVRTVGSVAEGTDVWAAQISESALWDVLDSDYITEDEADELDRQYGDDAKALFKQMQEFATNYENSCINYDENKMRGEVEEDSLDEIVDKMDEIKESDTAPVYLEAYELLNQYNANSDMPLGEWIVEMGNLTMEEADLTQIYPIIDSMSYAQVKMTELTGFVQCAATLGANEHSEEYTEILNTARSKLKKLLGSDSMSLWLNCDPDMMNKKIAFTSDAIRQSAAQTLLSEEQKIKENIEMPIAETALKWAGLVSSALTVATFVLGKYFIGGLLLYIGKVAACATLTTVASTMISAMSYLCTCGAVFGIFVLVATIVYFVVMAVMKWYERTEPKDYTEIPDYVIDTVKVDKGYSNVTYKAVLNNYGAVGDLNGHQGHRGWVCMYTSTDPRVGSPIRADSDDSIFEILYGNSSKPADCDCANFFGQVSPGNCNTNAEKDKVGGIYINYHTEKALLNSRAPFVDTDKDPKSKDADKTKYYYDTIIVKTGTKEDIAKAKITLEEHYIWDVNLSPEARTRWETDGQYTYIGYKITTDPDEAIRDIRVATFTPGGVLAFGEIKYSCAGPIGYPASNKEEMSDCPEDMDGLFFTRDKKAGTPIEVGKLHLVNSFSQADPGWVPVTTFSGAPYNFATTRYNSQGYGAYKPGRLHVYPFSYTGYCCVEDNTWDEVDSYLYYEPEVTYTDGTKYLSGIFYAFGTDSKDTGGFVGEVVTPFWQFTDKLKTFPNTTVRTDLNLAQSYYYAGIFCDSEQKYLYLCYTWSYNPYRALYGISVFQGTACSPNLPYTLQKAISYTDTLSGNANKTMSYASASVLVQRSTQHDRVVRGISPENAYMTTTGLIGQNDQVQKGYTTERIGFFGNSGSYKRTLFPTGLYVSGYVEGKPPITLEDVVITSNAYTAVENNCALSVDLSNERTLAHTNAKGDFVSVQDLKKPAETAPYNLAYPSWTNDDLDHYDAGSPLYIYFKDTVIKKRYISKVFVGSSSRSDAKTNDNDILKEFDKQVDLNALVAATAASSDEVIPVNAAADYDKAWYNRQNSSNSNIDVTPAENQPAAYIGVARTDNPDNAIRGLMLYKCNTGSAVPNQMNVDGAAYYCASNTSPIKASNGNSYYLYYSYNMGVSSGGPVTDISIGKFPLVSGQTTALVADRADSADSKAALNGDTTLKTFIRAKYETTNEQVYFNKLYAAVGMTDEEAGLKLLEQGCTQYLSLNLNAAAGYKEVYLGYRTFTINETSISLKADSEKAAAREAQLSQAIYDIVCTVGEPFKPEGFLSQKYQIYYTPVVMVDPNNKSKIQGVDLNDYTNGQQIYMYYTTPYAAKEYNQRVKNDRKAWLSSMPNNYFSAPITKIALARQDRVPYNETVDSSTSGTPNILRWEYVLQANSTKPIDLNEGAVYFGTDKYALDNRISMFVQREDGSVKESAEITGGYTDSEDDRGYLYLVK